MKVVKPFLVIEWLTIIGATTAAYIRWDVPLYICLGIVIVGVILTLYFSKENNKNIDQK
jgi:hypothetical protein